MIAGQRTLVLARVIQGGEVLELRPEDLRTLVARDAGLSEIFLRAFVLRRLLLINRQLGNAVVIGSRHSADTLRLRDFFGPKWSSIHLRRPGFGRYCSELSRPVCSRCL
jgi:thioredoxin reductase (NADPH)